MSKNEKFFVFQTKQDGTQVEVGRKAKGPGRPPVGPNIMKADDGNIYITDVLLEEPKDVANYIEVELEDTTVWYQKLKPVAKNVTKCFSLSEDGTLVYEGVAGRGRPKKNYVKIDTDLIIDGVNLNGHFYKGEVEEVEEVEVAVDSDYEEVEEDDLEAQAMADAAADFAADGGEFAADGGEFEEVEFEEEETV